MPATIYRPGDTLFVHGRDVLARIVQMGTGSEWNHCALVASPTGALIEATASGVHASHVRAYAAYRTAVGTPPLDDAGRARAVAWAQGLIGEQYDWGAILGIALRRLVRSQLLIGEGRHVICSELVAVSYAAAGLVLPQSPLVTDPADLAAFLGVANRA